MSEQKTISQIFGLRRDNFILDPVTDYECFARDDIKTRDLAESLDIDVVTGLAPKRLLWGPYGGGKTHTLMATMQELQKLTDVVPIRIECPDLSKKSRFHDLFREGIMRGIGQQLVLSLLEKVIEKVGYRSSREELLAELTKWLGDEELARATETLMNPRFERLKLWRWLSAVGMSKGDLDELGQSQDLTQAEAARLAGVVVTIGSLLRAIKKRTLVLILDEMERLNAIGPETLTTFMSGFTRLVDPNQTDVSILIGSSAALEAEMVDIFSENSPVTSRLGSENKIEIPALADPDVDRFLAGVVSYLRNPDHDVAAALGTAESSGEACSAELYPFTNEALDALKSRLQTLTPRAITMDMTRALGRAHRKGQNIITSDCIA